MKKSEIKKIVGQYPKFVEWSEGDGCFIGRCPVLFSGGVYSTDEPAVYAELCQAAEEWVELMLKDKFPLPKARKSKSLSGKFVVRIDPACTSASVA